MTQLLEKLSLYVRLVRLDRPIGILLLLWPTWWALWIAAEGFPSAWVFIVFTVGVTLMRSAGCAINDFADRAIDGHVLRTQSRPLATQEISSTEAIAIFVTLSLISFGLVLLTNTLTVQLSFVAVLLAAIYPFMKRYTYLPQVVLGMAFSCGIPMAFAAETNTVPLFAWLLYVANLLWTTAYDTMYAMVDRDDDLRIGVKSTAILFGDDDKVIVGILQLVTLATLVLAGIQFKLHWPFYLGLAAATGLAVYQQWLIRDRNRERCFQAFLNNSWFGAAVFAGIFTNYLLYD